jgi:hypothetical protein
MNKSIILGLSLAAIALFFAYLFVGEKTSPSAKVTDPTTQVAASKGRIESAIAPAEMPTLKPDSNEPQAIINAIQAMATTYDVVKTPEIQPYLDHPDPNVRRAAMNGIVELGYPTGAKVLREAAARAVTPEEAALLNARADFLLLPSTYQMMKSKKFGVPMPAIPAPK